MHRCVVTGGFGLLGRRIVRHLLSAEGSQAEGAAARVMVIDKDLPGTMIEDYEIGAVDADGGKPARGATSVSVVRGDLGSPHVAAAIKSFAGAGGDGDATSLSVFHLASVMSAQGELDFAEALRVNIDGKSLAHSNTPAPSEFLMIQQRNPTAPNKKLDHASPAPSAYSL